MIINFPWPQPALWPNVKDKAHWRKTSEAKKKAKADAGWLVTPHRTKLRLCDHRHLTLTFYPPTARRFDLDNVFAAMKPTLDALSEAWGVDDSEWTFTLERGPKHAEGLVAVEIGARTMALPI